MYSLHDRTKDACSQLMRYGGVYNEAMLDLLNTFAELNENMYNDVDRTILVQNIRVLVADTFKVAEGY